MARLVYEITGDISGLQSAINQGIGLIKDLNSQSSNINIAVPDISAQFKNGIAALDQLGTKLAVVQGNAELFGDSVKLQTQEVGAYQSALNSLLANGFEPMDADVQRLKQRIDDLNASLKSVKSVQVPGSFTNDTSPLPSAENVARPNITGSVAQESQLIGELNAQLAAGTITLQEYNQAILSANSAAGTLANTTQEASAALAQEDGYIVGLKQALADLNSIKINAPQEALAGLNKEIQQTEVALQQANNIGKVGFDNLGNAIKGVSVQNINGQLLTLNNNLFGARQIARDVVRTFDTNSISGFAKGVGLLATDFLYYAQSAQFAAAATGTATTAIAAESTVATTAGLSTAGLGAAFSSLLTPVNLIILGVAVLGGAFLAYEKSQKTATQSATEHLKAIQAQKQALNDLVSTLSAQEQVNAHAAENYAAQTIKLNELVFAVKNNTGALFDGKTALEDLQKLYPAFFADIDTAASKTDKFTEATNGAKEALKALGQFTAANKLAEQSIELAQSNQVAADSLLPGLQKAQQAYKSILALAQQLSTVRNGDRNVNQVAQVAQAKAAITGILEQIQTYNTAVAEANAKTSAFFDIANKNAPKAGLLSIKPDKVTEVVNQFDSLNQQLNQLIEKSSSLAGNSGISGYAAEVAAIVKQFTDLNNLIAKFQIAVNKAFDAGALTLGQRNSLLGPLPNIQANLPKNEDAAINQARIKDAQATADAIQKINDQFGIKEQAGFNEELSRIKKLYDSIVEANQEKANSLSAIDARYQAAVANANGNSQALRNAKLNYDAQVQDAKDAQAKIAAAQKDLLPAIQAIDQKYIEQETQTYAKILDIANQAFEALDTGEAARTDKINLEWQKRATSANAYFDKLRDLAKATKLPQSATDSINNIQTQLDIVIDKARLSKLSEEISKPFADAIQGALNGLVTNLYSSITNLGAQREAIDEKYFSQLASASDASTVAQIENLKRLEQQSTTSFGAVFSSLVSKFNSTFNESILNSFTKQLTENLGKTLIAPTGKQLTISPEQQAAQNVANLLKNAGTDLASQIKQAGVEFANSVKAGNPNGLLNALPGTSSAINTNELTAVSGGIAPKTAADLQNTISTSGEEFSNTVNEGAADAGTTINKGATSASTSISNAGSQLSLKVAQAAAGLSIAGGLISGATSPTSSVGQGIGGALQGAGEGALIGSAIPVIGTVAGAVIGGVIGGISGLLGASKAKKQEELQEKQLAAQQETNNLIARQNALAYTTSIIGRMTNQGIITSVDLNSFGQLTAVVSGKDLQFVLGRAANGR